MGTLVLMPELCVHHRGCIFMRGLWSDLLRPLTQEHPTCYWLMSDVSGPAEPAWWRSDGQLVFLLMNRFPLLLLSRESSRGKVRGTSAEQRWGKKMALEY